MMRELVLFPMGDAVPSSIVFLAPCWIAAFFTLAITVLVWQRRTLKHGLALFWATFWISVWMFAYAAGTTAYSLEAKRLALGIELNAQLLAVTAWLLFVQDYARGEEYRCRWLSGFLWGAIVLNMGVILTNGWHHLVWRKVLWPPTEFFAVLHVVPGTWLYIQQSVIVSAYLAGITILLRQMRHRQGVFRKQVAIVLIASLWLALGHLLTIANIHPLGPIDALPVTVIVGGLLLAWGVLRTHLLAFTPALREHILDVIPGLVMALDRDGRILDMNAALEAVVGKPKEAILGRPYHQVFAAWEEQIARIENAETYPVDVSFPEAGKPLCYQITITPLDSDGGRLLLAQDVTRARALQRDIVETNARMWGFLANSPDVIVIKDADGRWVLANQAALELFGFSETEYRGRTDAQLAESFPDRREAISVCAENNRQAWESRRTIHTEHLLTLPGGGVRILDIVSTPLYHPDGSPRELLVLMHDITMQKETEQRMRQQTVRFQLMLEITARMNALQTPEEIYAYLCRQGTDLLSADGSALYLHDPERHLLHYVASYALPENCPKRQISCKEGVMGRIVETRQPLLINDYGEWLEHLLEYHQGTPPYHGVVGVPIVWQDSVHAVLTVLSRSPQSAFGRDAVELLYLLANQAGGVLESAYLLQNESRQRELAESLRRTTLALNTSLELDEVFTHLLEEVRRLLPYDSASVMKICDEDSVARIVHAVGYESYLSPDQMQYLFHLRLRIADVPNLLQVVTSGKPTSIPDTRADLAWAVLPTSPHVHSWIGVPVLVNGKVTVIFSLDSVTPHAYQKNHEVLLSTFASHASLAIQNALLFERIRKLALTDELTWVPNRRQIFMVGEREVRRAQRFSQAFSLIMLDIDHFKRINDTYGHLIGDEVLKVIARRCQGVIREVDILGRYGGEEFCVLLPEANLAQAHKVAERLRLIVAEEALPTSAGGVRLTISLGIATLTPDTETLQDLLDVADQGLYTAKQDGRNRVRSVQML